MTDAIEEDVDDRRGVEREYLAQKKSANHGNAQRTTELRTHALTQSQRKTRQQCGHGGHHDGAEAQQAGIIDRIRGDLDMLSFSLNRKVDHHDSVLLDNADQENDADDGDDAEVLLEDNQSQ